MRNSKYVRVMLRGGLGNQLFQYAAGYSKSKELNLPLLIDTSLLPEEFKSSGKISVWAEQISTFNHSGHLKTGRSTHRRINRVKSAYFLFLRIIGDRLPRFPTIFGTYSNNISEVPALLKQQKGPVTINSYCNSLEYFISESEEIREEIKILKNPSSWFEENLVKIMNRSCVALHVRLGDYKNLETIYGKFDFNYFKNATNLFKEFGDVDLFLVFSDEPKLAQEKLTNLNVPMEFIAAPTDSAPIESMILISKCKGLIASNSSFSWWAGFLGGDNFKVVFPRPMFALSGPDEPKNWLPEKWIQLGKGFSN